jgi:hypothetical protein
LLGFSGNEMIISFKHLTNYITKKKYTISLQVKKKHFPISANVFNLDGELHLLFVLYYKMLLILSKAR